MLDASHRLDVQRAMTRGSGPVRSGASTAGALEALAALAAAAADATAEPGPATWETTNLLHLGQALSLVAHRREETRGGHVRSDFPERDDAHWLAAPHDDPAGRRGCSSSPSGPVEADPMTDHGFPHDRRPASSSSAPSTRTSATGTDVTTMATIPASQQSVVAPRGPGRRRGRRAARSPPSCSTPWRLGSGPARWGSTAHVDDGTRVARGDHLATLRGATRTTLVAERTVLNVLSRTSGVATHTRRWADVLEGSGAMVLDTRKTTPGMRALEKYAVRCGGGTNKRMGLYDVAMIKDNHKLAAGGLTAAYDAVRRTFPDVAIQVEVTTTAEALESVRAGARFLLCDNMSPTSFARPWMPCAPPARPVEIEATGNLTLEVAAAYAATGVDYLSVGGLTHSSPILDIALDLDPEGD